MIKRFVLLGVFSLFFMHCYASEHGCPKPGVVVLEPIHEEYLKGSFDYQLEEACQSVKDNRLEISKCLRKIQQIIKEYEEPKLN